MTHIWVRAEQRENEERVGITPQGASELISAGMRVTVEQSEHRVIPVAGYKEVGCGIAPAGSWSDAPRDALIFGLKELPDDGSDLHHRHIMFGHAFKEQPAGTQLLKRFKAGGGVLFDLEYLADENARRVAAFGYWAGFVGAAVSLKCWLAQQKGTISGPVSVCSGKGALVDALQSELGNLSPPSAIIIGALGRVGTGASDLCVSLGMEISKWDMEQTATGGPFLEILTHDIFLNCILAAPGTPVFVEKSALTARRNLSVIGDIACDPESEYSPIKVYSQATSWAEPALRVWDDPVFDVTAIDNLPSLLPKEASEDFAQQLLPSLRALDRLETGVWARAKALFDIKSDQV